MKVILEFSDQERMEVMDRVGQQAAEIADTAVREYFDKISVEDFIMLLRRALRASCDSFFQQYMQCYIEKRSPEIFKKIFRDAKVAEEKRGS